MLFELFFYAMKRIWSRAFKIEYTICIKVNFSLFFRPNNHKSPSEDGQEEQVGEKPSKIARLDRILLPRPPIDFNNLKTYGNDYILSD